MLRRLIFNVPGDSARKLQKTLTLPLDSCVLDFEDGVDVARKADARRLVADHLLAGKRANNGRAEMLVRVNADDEHLDADLGALQHVPRHAIDGLVVPKVESAAQLRHIDAWIDRVYGANDSMLLLLAIESARGLLDLRDICNASRRANALIFASEDLCANMGLTRTDEAKEMLYARSRVVMYARAHQLQAIDMVCIKYNDIEQLERECIDGANMGFTAKQAIHPKQIETVQRLFRPSAEQRAFAERIVDAYRRHQGGAGAFTVDDIVVDAPVVKWAQRILVDSTETGNRN
jgi:citrate lyase subunit beta-like protein